MDNSLLSRRIKAIIIDFFILFILTIVLLVIILIVNKDKYDFIYCYALLMCIVYSTCFLKDIIGGQSLGKRIYKLQVKNDKGKVPPTKILILRNIFVFIYPIEIILCFVNNGRRLGDIILKTKVTDKDS
ncbi:RDD family protein [Dysgonomonas sp. ZJ709]|uniref:RDD family protein n=1 Tax=Dysgonomonas sp. ZJ709 TaxID=2709797 RepID=UPI0013EB2670